MYFINYNYILSRVHRFRDCHGVSCNANDSGCVSSFISEETSLVILAGCEDSGLRSSLSTVNASLFPTLLSYLLTCLIPRMMFRSSARAQAWVKLAQTSRLSMLSSMSCLLVRLSPSAAHPYRSNDVALVLQCRVITPTV